MTPKFNLKAAISQAVSIRDNAAKEAMARKLFEIAPALCQTLRHCCGISQSQMADSLGIQSPNISYWENSKNLPSPSLALGYLHTCLYRATSFRSSEELNSDDLNLLRSFFPRPVFMSPDSWRLQQATADRA